MNNKKTRIIFLVLGGLACVFALRKNFLPVRIEYRDNSFYPEQVVLHRGERVTFVNHSKKAIWPASDPHPSHLYYPEFDSLEPIRPGQSWSMVFSETGQWSYHNHLGSNYSQDTGVIIVLEAGQPLDSLMDEQSRSLCLSREKGSRFLCWKTRLGMMTKTKGVAEAFKELTILYELDTEVSEGCNNLTHAIGGAAASEYVKTKKDIWIPETLNCGGGFYHGFMEVYLSRNKHISEAITLCDRITEQMGRQGHAAQIACYHGIGHGITEMLGIHAIYDWKKMAGDLLRNSAQKCREYMPSGELYDRCLNGIFNSFHIHYANSFNDTPVDESDFFWICRGISETDFASFCYHEMAIFLSENKGVDAALNSLSKAIPPDYLEHAVYGVIQTYIFSQATLKDYASYIQLCRKNQESHVAAACVRAIVDGFFNNGPPNNEFATVVEFCETGYLTNNEKELCFREAGLQMKYFYGDGERMEKCSTLSKLYKTFCLSNI